MAKLESVNVYLRLRDDGHHSKHNIVEVLSDREIQLKHQHPKRFGFNRVFTSKSSQAALYNNVVAPLVDKALNGFTCTLLTYGQSGSGKSYTLFGDVFDQTRYGSEDSADGCIPRALVSIFEEMKKLNKNFERTVRVSYVELFNEELIDLLFDNSEPAKHLRILEDPQQKGSMYIQNLSARTICDPADIKKIFETAQENRHNSPVLENAEGRSHKIFIVNVYTRIVVVPGEEHLKSGKIFFVDTAACEHLRKTAKGSRKGNTMNQSLVTLTNAVRALEERSQYVPLSESKLTKILRESFRGRSKTAVIATVSLLRSDIDDTLNTLTFAKGARTIKNPVEMNKVTTKSNIVNCLYEELAKLQKDLIALRSSTGFYVHAENYTSIIEETSKKEKELNEKMKQIADMEERIKELEVEKLLREKEWEGVMKSFEITKRRAIMHKTNLLKRRLRLENVKDAVEATETAIEPIIEQNRELKSLLEETTTNYKILHDKTDSAQKNLLQNDLLGRNFCETVVNTCETAVKTLQGHDDGTLESLTKSFSNVLDTAELLSEECCENADKMETCFGELESALIADKTDKMKADVKESFAAFSIGLQECFEFLDSEKQLLEKRLCSLRIKLQENAEEYKRFNQKQLETTSMLQNVNDGLVQSISTQTTSLNQLTETMGAIQTDVHSNDQLSQKSVFCDQLQQKLQMLSQLNQQEETTRNNIDNTSKNLQTLAVDRTKVISEDVVKLEEASKSIHQCAERLAKENNVAPLTAFDNTFDFVALQKQLLAIEKHLQEDMSCLEKNSDKEEICTDIVNRLQVLSQNSVGLAVDLQEQLTTEAELFKTALDELQEKKDAMYSEITGTVNGVTGRINTCIRQLEDSNVLQSIENNQLHLSEQGLLEEDCEDIKNSQMIREILEKFNKLK